MFQIQLKFKKTPNKALPQLIHINVCIELNIKKKQKALKTLRLIFRKYLNQKEYLLLNALFLCLYLFDFNSEDARVIKKYIYNP